MSDPEGANRRAIITATVIVACLLAASGVGYRALAAYLGGGTESEPLPSDALARLAMQIGDWVGKDVPLPPDVIDATGTDAHISRQYSRRSGADSVWAYLAYGVRARDLMPHRPEVCYRGNGWTLDDSRTAELPLADGATLGCRILHFSRGGLTARRTVVLNYYIVDGKHCPDVSLLRSRAWRGSGAIRYMAQVQITCSDDGLYGTHAADKSVCAFAVDSAQAVRSLFSNTGGDLDANATSPVRAQHGGASDG